MATVTVTITEAERREDTCSGAERKGGKPLSPPFLLTKSNIHVHVYYECPVMNIHM